MYEQQNIFSLFPPPLFYAGSGLFLTILIYDVIITFHSEPSPHRDSVMDRRNIETWLLSKLFFKKLTMENGVWSSRDFQGFQNLCMVQCGYSLLTFLKL